MLKDQIKLSSMLRVCVRVCVHMLNSSLGNLLLEGNLRPLLPLTLYSPEMLQQQD